MNQQTSGFDVQGKVGSHIKGTKASAVREAHPKLFCLLDAAPVLAFSEVGRRNVCRRFNISDETLEKCLRAYLRPGELENEQAQRDADLQHVTTVTPALLDAISKAVAPKKGAAKLRKAKEGHANG